MNTVPANKVMSGTWGYAKLNGMELAEISAGQAKISVSKEKIQMARSMMTDAKITSCEGTGSVTLHKIRTLFAEYLEKVKAGIDVRPTIILGLDDPDAYGAEAISLHGVSFDDFTLQDWTVGKSSSVTVPFTFTGWKFLSKVDA